MSVFDQVDHFIVLCSSQVRSDGTATMLDGAAGQLAAIHTNLPTIIGQWLTEQGIQVHNYSLKCTTKVGLFQHVIIHRHGTNLGCVSAATKALRELALANPDKSYALDAPGKNDPWFLVKDLMLSLPDNVQLWNSTRE